MSVAIKCRRPCSISEKKQLLAQMAFTKLNLTALCRLGVSIAIAAQEFSISGVQQFIQ